MRLCFTPAARAEFLGVIEDVSQDDPAAARRFRGKAENALRRLTRYPDSGRRLPEFPDLPFREVIVGAYRFFYRQEGETIWIVGVRHGAREMREP